MNTFFSFFTLQIDSLRDSSKRNHRRNGGVAPYAKGESSPSSPSISDSSDSINSIKKQQIHKDNNGSDASSPKKSSANNFTSATDDHVMKSDRERVEVNSRRGDRGANSGDGMTSDMNGCATSNVCKPMQLRSNNIPMDSVDSSASQSPAHKLNSIRGVPMVPPPPQQQQQQNNHSRGFSSSSSSSAGRSGSVSSPDGCYSVPTSPTSTPTLDAATKQKDASISVPTSPETGAQEILLRRNQNQNGVMRKCDAAGFRTSRSEDHLQHTQRDTLGAVVSIDIDEDMNSSLNTLLDTRHDSEDSQVNFKCTNKKNSSLFLYV